MDRSAQTRPPSHPGEILWELYLQPSGLNVNEFAKQIRVAPEVVAALINREIPVDPDLSSRLARAFQTTPELWLNLQRNLDSWQARRQERLPLARRPAMS